MKIDWYTKFILTVIAVLLLGILIKPGISPQKAQAGPGEGVYVENSDRNPIPVTIVGGTIEVENTRYSGGAKRPLLVRIVD